MEAMILKCFIGGGGGVGIVVVYIIFRFQKDLFTILRDIKELLKSNGEKLTRIEVKQNGKKIV